MSFVNLMTLLYPIGSLYFSTSATSPATTMGGTWSQVTDGVLACAGSEGFAEGNQSGGSLYITESNLPSHQHSCSPDGLGHSWSWYANGGDNAGNYNLSATAQVQGYDGSTANYLSSYQNYYSNTGYTGGGAEYYPLHYSCYVWRRTA